MVTRRSPALGSRAPQRSGHPWYALPFPLPWPTPPFGVPPPWPAPSPGPSPRPGPPMPWSAPLPGPVPSRASPRSVAASRWRLLARGDPPDRHHRVNRRDRARCWRPRRAPTTSQIRRGPPCRRRRAQGLGSRGRGYRPSTLRSGGGRTPQRRTPVTVIREVGGPSVPRSEEDQGLEQEVRELESAPELPPLRHLVGGTGLEPVTPCVSSKCSTMLS